MKSQLKGNMHSKQNIPNQLNSKLCTLSTQVMITGNTSIRISCNNDTFDAVIPCSFFYSWNVSFWELQQNVVKLNIEFQKRCLFYDLKFFADLQYHTMSFVFEIHAFIEES